MTGRGPDAVLRYGRHRAQRAELWLPAGPGGRRPAVVLLHGGYWRAQYTKRLMVPLARAVAALGWAAVNVEYRRVGPLGGGGGWPGTFEDVAAALDHLGGVAEVDAARLVTCGHSAGGHLALWAAARARLPAGAPGSAPAVRPVGAVSLAGVVDLHEASRLGLGAGAATALLGGDPGRHPDRYAQASPAALLPLGVAQVLLHGEADATVPPALSAGYVERARDLGDPAELVLLPGVDHMAIISPDGPAWAALQAALGRLLA